MHDDAGTGTQLPPPRTMPNQAPRGRRSLRSITATRASGLAAQGGQRRMPWFRVEGQTQSGCSITPSCLHPAAVAATAPGRSTRGAAHLARRMAWAVLSPAGPPPTMQTSVLMAGSIRPAGVWSGRQTSAAALTWRRRQHRCSPAPRQPCTRRCALDGETAGQELLCKSKHAPRRPNGEPRVLRTSVGALAGPVKMAGAKQRSRRLPEAYVAVDGRPYPLMNPAATEPPLATRASWRADHDAPSTAAYFKGEA